MRKRNRFVAGGVGVTLLATGIGGYEGFSGGNSSDDYPAHKIKAVTTDAPLFDPGVGPIESILLISPDSQGNNAVNAGRAAEIIGDAAPGKLSVGGSAGDLGELALGQHFQILCNDGPEVPTLKIKAVIGGKAVVGDVVLDSAAMSVYGHDGVGQCNNTSNLFTIP